MAALVSAHRILEVSPPMTPIEFSAVLMVLVPGRNTVLLIGASQVGEQIIQLQEVQEFGGDIGALASDTITLLRQVVSDQIGEGQ